MRLNHSVPAPEEPKDWFAEFDPEPEPVHTAEQEDSTLQMFPSDVVQRPQPREQQPLFRVVPAGPPSEPQRRVGEYPGPPSSFFERVLPAGDYRAGMLRLVRRRRTVVVATAVIVLISSAATAASFAVRRWQRQPEKVSDQIGFDAGEPGSPAAALFGATVGQKSAMPSPLQAQMPTLDTLSVTKAVTGRTAPADTSAAGQITSMASQTSKGRSSFDAPATAASSQSLPMPTPASTSTPAKRSVMEPPATPARTPAPTPIRTPAVPSVTPSSRASTAAPTATPTPTGTPTATPVPPLTSTPATTAPAPRPTPAATPTAPPRPTPPAGDDAKAVAETAPPAVSPEAAEKAAVHGVLDRYRQAFASLSVNDVAEFWPSVNVRSLGRAFDQLESQNVTFDTCTVEVRGAQADATCRGRVQYVPKVGSKTPRVDAHQWSFLLQRTRAGWGIMRVDVK